MDSTPNILKILQGIPGDGRNNYIREQIGKRVWPMYAMVCSEAQYTPEVLKEYNPLIETTRTPEALCFRRVVQVVTSGAPFVVIDNVNALVTDVAPYVRLSEAYGYEYEIIFVETDYSTDEEAVIHRTISYGDWPSEWNRSVVKIS